MYYILIWICFKGEIMKIISFIYNLLWGDLITIPLSKGSIGISLLILLLIPCTA